MRISVAIIAKNESAVIERCLRSVQEADELIFVDTGSTDNTIDIVRQIPMKFYSIFTEFKWCDDFARARNFAMSKCTGDWILSIDADDYLVEGGMARLRKIAELHTQERCFSIDFISEGGRASHKLPYFYKNCPEVYWKGAAHNYLTIPATVDSGATIIYGHSPAHKNDPDRTLRILRNVVTQSKEDLPRETFYLAREYEYRKNWKECLYWTARYLVIAWWGPEMADNYLRRAKCYRQLNDLDNAQIHCLKAIQINTHFKEALLFMAGLSGPINKESWLLMAEFADNSNVLFTRNKTEKPASYYEALNDTEDRYTNIYRMVGQMVESKTMLDVGCGQGKLSDYIEHYDGLDMVQNPYKVADIYSHEYVGYEVYVMLEVLEHLTRDKTVLGKVPSGKEVIFSVPSFDDPAHVRMFTERIVRWRYKDLIKFDSITRFNFDNKVRKWKTDFCATPSYIMLCRGTKI
jgi:glycosyltransferase involved in cell wall biosynthesis